MSPGAVTHLVRCPSCGSTNRVADEKMKSGMAPVCARCRTPLIGSPGSGHPITITDSNFASEVQKSSIPVLLDFWAGWCGPCRMIAPIVEELAGELDGKVKVGKLDVDDNQVTASQFGVRSIPTLLVFNGGREVGRIVGVQSKASILSKLKPFIQ